MRKLRVLMAATAVMMLLGTPVSGAPASNGDFVSGSGYRLSADGNERRVQFNAYAQADTNGAWGSYWYRNLAINLTFSGQVKCLDVSGNQTAIGGVITRLTADPSPGFGVGDKFLVFLIDNSDQNPANPDVVSGTYILPLDSTAVAVPRNFPATCPDAATTAHDAFLVQGDIAIGNVNS
ncbi:MAG: hypothetical protein WEB29_04990 [Chloroflexota bacterium]